MELAERDELPIAFKLPFDRAVDDGVTEVCGVRLALLEVVVPVGEVFDVVQPVAVGTERVGRRLNLHPSTRRVYLKIIGNDPALLLRARKLITFDTGRAFPIVPAVSPRCNLSLARKTS